MFGGGGEGWECVSSVEVNNFSKYGIYIQQLKLAFSRGH